MKRDKKSTDGARVRLDSFRLNDKNPRKIGDAAFKRLCASVKDFPKMMAIRPIVVDKDGIVIGGNMRYRACIELGMQDVPAEWVRNAEDLTKSERKRFILADNAPDGLAGEWDFDMLANEWEIPDLIDAGFSEDELAGDSVQEEQERIDKKKTVTCPSCGHEFTT